MSISKNISLAKICPNEFIGFASIKWRKKKFRLREDYYTLFVHAEDTFLYCQRMLTLYGKLVADIGRPIVVVLESPHVDEFFSNPLQVFNGGVVYCRPANGVARGAAGVLLKEWLSEVLVNTKALADGLLHPIIIANACQYQCSEGLPTRTGPRDENFLELFCGSDPRFNSTVLVQRLVSYNPSKIIVACTKGKSSFIKAWLFAHNKGIFSNVHEFSLRGCVELALHQSCLFFVSVGHPCSWFKSNCRKVRNIQLLKRPRT